MIHRDIDTGREVAKFEETRDEQCPSIMAGKKGNANVAFCSRSQNNQDKARYIQSDSQYIFLRIHEKNERHKLTSFSTCGANTASGMTVHKTLMSPKADLSTSLPFACIRVSTASTNCSKRGPRMMSSGRRERKILSQFSITSNVQLEAHSCLKCSQSLDVNTCLHFSKLHISE